MEASDNGSLTVLVVDDEIWIAEELALGLEESGLSVKMATSAATAQLVLSERDDIGVVVTDIRMPGEDGLSLVRRLVMNRPALRAVETVVMTGHATIEDAVAAVRAGAFDFVRKPFTLDEMIEVVRGALARATAKRAEAQAALDLARAQAEGATARQRDSVTGLPDRAAFAAHLAEILAEGPERRRESGVIALDLDQFGALNEASGSAAGDAVLIEIGRRLRDAAGHGWMVARIGSDEFAAVTTRCPNPAALQEKAEMLRAAIERPISLHGDSFRMTASLGVAHGSVAGRIPLDAAAALAVGAARRDGGARCAIFTQELQDAAERRLTILQDLQHAIARQQVALHYQPVFRIADRGLIGFEALLRWKHPTLGPVSPAEFIPLAEEGRLILDLGAWALDTAAAQVAAWHAMSPAAPYVAVNMSGRQIADVDMPALFSAALARHGLPGSALVAEVTETVALGRNATESIAALQALGVKVALDDFGMGYSSLGVLGSLRVDTVKLDRSLVAGIATEPREQRLFNGLVATVRTLGLNVVVEGIETEGQLQVAALAGCHAAQGYLLGRPMPAEVATALVTQPR